VREGDSCETEVGPRFAPLWAARLWATRPEEGIRAERVSHACPQGYGPCQRAMVVFCSMAQRASTERCPPPWDGEQMMDTPPEALPIEEIVRRYPHQWVLVEETAWDTHGHPTGGSHARQGYHGAMCGSRCIAVIMIGPSPPFCCIRVRRVLTTSPWCSETPRRSHPWPAGVRGWCAFLPKKGVGLKVLTGHGAELDTTSAAGGRGAASQTGDVSAAAVWYSTRCEDERSRRIRVPSHRGWCTATGSAGRPITHSGRAWPWRNGGPT
jgi:hypothetical protein